MTVGPIVDQFAAEAKGKIRVGKLNINASPHTASRLNILGVPFMFVYDNGQIRETWPGVGSKHELMTKMAPYI